MLCKRRVEDFWVSVLSAKMKGATIMRKFSALEITIYGLGAAMFVVVGCCFPIPITGTTAHIDLGYMIMAVFAYLFGPIAGMLVGGLGRFIEDMILFGSIGSPGWLIASICMGFLTGIIFGWTKKFNRNWTKLLVNVSGILVVNAVFLVGFAPWVSSMWNGVPYVAKLPSGVWAFITNDIAMIVLGLPLALMLEKVVPDVKKRT